MGYFPYVMKTFYIHIKLFKTLGYKLDLEKGEYPIEEPINIYKDNELVGLLKVENQNLLDFKNNNIEINNMKLDKLNEKKDYSRHNKLLFHTYIDDNGLIFDNYNALLTGNNRNNICLKNDEYRINYELDKGITITRDSVKNPKSLTLRGDKK
ncbi:MAG: hypothetical protein IKE73_05000 [Bacilli bacterium]|nr:hypothetical protein [Bacilli bacterium]